MAPNGIDDAHLQPAEAVAAQLAVRPDAGLSSAEAARRAAEQGPNRLPEQPPRPWWRRVLHAFAGDVMVLVLLAAAIVSGIVGDLTDTIVILVIVVLNTAIGLVQEWRAERALAALARIAAPHALVRRDGASVRIDSEALVPGDVVLLEAGHRVPADLRLFEVAQLRVDESTLTGESVTVDKHSRALEGDGAASLPLGDRTNMAFKGTLVTHGRAEGLVVATGAATELGRIATLMGSAVGRSTPLQLRLAAFGRRLSAVVLVICALVFALGVARGEPLLAMLLTAISLAVAAIPEALPAVVTVLLALGARRLVQVQALVRRLPAVETLGSVTVICTDKTGTLTENRMTVAEHRAWGSASAFWSALVLCNDATSGGDGDLLGDPTETALLAEAARQGFDARALRAASPRVAEWPFDAERKRMSTLHAAAGDEGALRLCVKGAPETTLPCCTGAAVGAAQALAREWASAGLRVLAVAERKVDPRDLATLTQAEAAVAESGLELQGLVGLIDPPRPEAAAAVAECRSAGVRTVMITGDHPATAQAIARRLGIDDGMVLTGPEVDRLDDAALADAAVETAVYARMDPAQKIRIVRALQARGAFVAMTGDGVNDAPALKAADIGVAMGRGGTDVAREAASLVLLDDNFATIVAAVREGRRIVDNIRKFVRYALTGNSGEIWTLAIAPLFALPVPLLPIHILWVNLVTDGLPGLALAAEPAERGVMRRPPRPPGESLFAGGLGVSALRIGLLIGALCLAVQWWGVTGGHPHWQTMVFTVLTFAQMTLVLAIRSERESLFAVGLAGNRPLLGAVASTVVLQLATIYVPWLQPIFRTGPLSAGELAACIGLALVVPLAVELEKAWWRAGDRRRERERAAR